MALSVLHNKDPRFDSGAYWPLGLFCNCLVVVTEPPGTKSHEWTEDGPVDIPPKELWKGYAAVNPNIAWRARDRRSAYDDTAVHAYYVHLNHIDKNLLVPKEKWGDRSLRFVPGYGQIVRVIENNSDPRNAGLRLVVRNAPSDSDFWQPTLLCDIDVDDSKGGTH